MNWIAYHRTTHLLNTAQRIRDAIAYLDRYDNDHDGADIATANTLTTRHRLEQALDSVAEQLRQDQEEQTR